MSGDGRLIRLGAMIGMILLAPNAAPSAEAAPAQSIPELTVVLGVIGTPPAGPSDRPYEVVVKCRNPVGGVVGERSVSLTPGASRVLGSSDIPGLVTADRCVASARAEGAQTEFQSTQPDRSDGSTPDPVGGLIDAEGFHSGPALANGQTIAITHKYTGDLLVTKTVTGAPEFSIGTYQLQVSCHSIGFLQTISLANSQTRLITAIPVGSVCRVTEPSTVGARFEDNSGDPFDGIVTITATPAACWDLRNTTAACRTAVVSHHAYNATDQQVDSALNTVPSQTTTTSPDTTQPAQAAATTAAPAAPAPVEEPELLDESEETVG